MHASIQCELELTISGLHLANKIRSSVNKIRSSETTRKFNACVAYSGSSDLGTNFMGKSMSETPLSN